MPDMEKVIKGLETCIPMKYETNEEKECRHEQCPYGGENYKPMNGCFWDLMSDALAMLKKQEPMEPITDKWRNYVCPVCGDRLRGGKFCMNCGQAVKLE